MGLPIIIYESREQLPFFFEIILKNSNVENQIYVLANQSGFSHNSKVEHVKLIDIPKYNEDLENFQLKYKHLSTNSKEMELACFARFFAMLRFMEQRGIQYAWHMDTDVWPTNDLQKFEKYVIEKGYGALLSGGYSDNSSLTAGCAIFDLETLNDFCKYLSAEFYDKNLKKLEKFYVDRINNGLSGGVCDMTALGMWVNQYNPKWINSYKFVIENTLIPQNLGQDLNDQFNELFINLKNSFEIFTLKKGRIICSIGGKKMNLASIHFGGHQKFLIKHFARFKIIIGSPKFIHLLMRFYRKTNRADFANIPIVEITNK